MFHPFVSSSGLIISQSPLPASIPKFKIQEFHFGHLFPESGAFMNSECKKDWD